MTINNKTYIGIIKILSRFCIQQFVNCKEIITDK